MHVTLFYSNTSPKCKALLQTIKNLRFDFTLKFVNIGNERMKSLVLQKFSVVPTIVILDKDEISLYTGENAFDWFAQLNNDSESDESVSVSQGGWIPQMDEVKPQATPEERLADRGTDSSQSDDRRQIPSGSGTTRSTKSLLEIATELAKERDNSQPQRVSGSATAK